MKKLYSLIPDGDVVIPMALWFVGVSMSIKLLFEIPALLFIAVPGLFVALFINLSSCMSARSEAKQKKEEIELNRLQNDLN